jgi:hypothetical protein
MDVWICVRIPVCPIRMLVEELPVSILESRVFLVSAGRLVFLFLFVVAHQSVNLQVCTSNTLNYSTGNTHTGTEYGYCNEYTTDYHGQGIAKMIRTPRWMSIQKSTNLKLNTDNTCVTSITVDLGAVPVGVHPSAGLSS